MEAVPQWFTDTPSSYSASAIALGPSRNLLLDASAELSAAFAPALAAHTASCHLCFHFALRLLLGALPEAGAQLPCVGQVFGAVASATDCRLLLHLFGFTKFIP